MKKLVVFIDSGDTLIQERTEVRDGRGVVLKAELAKGAGEALRALREAGYLVALVADGETESFRNMYTQHGLWDCFDAKITSGDVGAEKPAAAMFRAAMDALGLSDGDIPRIVMIGNNIKRDVQGANNMGITSVLARWSDRYDYAPTCPDEVPCHTIFAMDELFALIEALETKIQDKIGG